MFKKSLTKGVMLFGIFTCVYANTSNDQHVTVGWSWYNQPTIEDQKPQIIKKDIVKPKVTVTTSPTNKYERATKELEAFKKYYKGVHDYAALHPEDVEAVAYDYKLRNYMYDKSMQYEVSHQKAKLQYPSVFDTQVKYPTQSLARSIYKSQKQTNKINSVKYLAQSYGLFYFYNGNDQLDQTLSKSIQSFADEYHIGLIGISMDGVVLNTIKNNRVNNGEAKAFNVKAYPALFIANPYTHKSQALAYGFISEDELLTRFYNIATNYGTQNIGLNKVTNNQIKTQGVINV